MVIFLDKGEKVINNEMKKDIRIHELCQQIGELKVKIESLERQVDHWENLYKKELARKIYSTEEIEQYYGIVKEAD